MYQHARVDERALRQVEIAHLDHAVASRSACVGTRRPGCAPRPRRDAPSAPPSDANCSSATIAMSVSVRGCVYSSASSYWREQRDVIARVELVDAVLPALVQVHRARVRDREHARVVDRADRALLVAVDQPVLDRRSAAQPDVAARAGARPTSTSCRRAASAGRRARARARRRRGPSPNQRSSSGASGSSCAAHATWARSTNGFCGFTTARSGARRVSSRGCAAYHWSSWSSPATSTAAERRPVRPARPACCHIDASVPGKPLRITASRPPTSMPSSSAFVAAMPRSCPLDRSRSSSRRSSGR